MATLKVFWAVFFAVNLGEAVFRFSKPLGVPVPPQFMQAPPPEPHFFGSLGMIQLTLLGMIVILYGGFRMYYARKFGDWEADEE